MASMVVGGLFNAVAFTGACYLQKFNKDGYGEETRRRKKIRQRTTHLEFLRTVGRNERIHDVNHRDHRIGWWMDGSKNYI